ncbi:RodZ domain-containing protein [Paraglaciecola sp. L3A3]|uniref:RodZ domain-containing protein n=1 Tax=Paraglaciecola sp. L3A3 TaxID=2686358 RepID=UPI00131BEE28|nr:RodZ domain-containing protein [Paraglaciecola sp. L3A3]
MSEEQVPDKEVVIIGPGEILRKAREAVNLTPDDIALKIRLKKTLIEELEQDNYDINISLTFIKGYLKLYAKQVNVPEAEIVAAFEALNTQKKEPAKLQSFSRRFNHQANDDKLMLVTYLIVAAVIALAVVWWFQQSETEISLFSENTVTIEQETDNVSLKPYSQSSSTAELTDVESEISVDELSLPPVIEQTEDTITEQVEAVGSSLEDTQNDNGATVSTELTNTLDPIASQVPVTEAPIELVFEFLDNCWTNISDATGEDIAYGVKTKGRIMTITGIPPFVVTLGAPEVVKISYDGQPVDMSFIVPGRSAKFELPLSE